MIKSNYNNIINLLIVDTSNRKLLAVKRAETDTLFGGMWAMPGGHKKPTETIWECASRELLEETGAHLTSMKNELFMRSPLQIGNEEGTVEIYEADTDTTVFKPQTAEIENVKWLTPQELINSLRDHSYPEMEVSILEKKLAMHFRHHFK